MFASFMFHTLDEGKPLVIPKDGIRYVAPMRNCQSEDSAYMEIMTTEGTKYLVRESLANYRMQTDRLEQTNEMKFL